MTAHFVALAWASLVAAVAAVVFLGYGRFARVGLRLPSGCALDDMWLGWAVLIAVLQVAHLLMAITASAAFGLGVLGLGGLLVGRGRPAWRWSRAAGVAVGAWVIAACWLFSRAMEVPTNFDSGLYHFTSIKWIETFPVVKGLGNLHGRLAFNQSFFLFVAALDAKPLFCHGRGLANSLLLLMLAATLLRELVRQSGGDPLRRFLAAMLLPVTVYLAVSSNGVASPSPDLASTTIQLLLFFRLVCAFSSPTTSESFTDAAFLACIASVLITVKLSNAAFGAVTIVLAGVLAWNATRRLGRTFFLVGVPAALTISIWLLRGAILSGAPLFPSTVGWIPFDWAVPRSAITNEANWILSWARSPGIDSGTVLRDWAWLGPWAGRLLRAKIEVSYPLSVGVAMGLFALTLTWRLRRPMAKSAVAALPVGASLTMWFFTAPDVRFANAAFLLLPALGAFLLGEHARHCRPFVMRGILLAVILVGNAHIAYFIHLHRSELRRISTSGWKHLPRPKLSAVATNGGVPLLVPEEGQCWDAALLCTPRPDDRLAFRTPGRPAEGFRLIQVPRP